MQAIFLSDNHYFCSGISASSSSSYLIDENSDLKNILNLNNRFDVFFINVSCHMLRLHLLKGVKDADKTCVIMMDDIRDGCYYTFSDVIYASATLSYENLKKIIAQKNIPSISKLPKREKYVSSRLHLSDNYFAMRFGIQLKTAGAYRRDLIGKLMLKRKNTIAINRIQSCIIASHG
ncbi:hypothetical protein MUA04_21445 [Enterobacteriaceae bacterium H11S18]|uniref:hypothetical protein n=1 Tax=Dryocola clanedunensis TaxID=2925396 RepID=UPI0022F13B93|nr:hypothetical protein [Dryocola clanedunensis]MCT4712735.1 hypothetical protein [Dryocola clanedunensis]